jgi:uncharacterized membrane protein YraQ (UPF0718 family)
VKQKETKKAGKPSIAVIGLYVAFVAISWVVHYRIGLQMGFNLLEFAKHMFSILPFVFILIGLFEVWVPRETVEAHMGVESGWKGYLWAVILASPMAGGLYVNLPVAHSLYKKGASWGVVLTFIGAGSLCRIPMLLFESSFLGVKFSVLRLGLSLPLVIGSSVLIGRVLERKGYQISDLD